MGKTARRFALLSFLILPAVTHAQLAITEVMFDLAGGDTGREWIEVHNTSAEPIALSEWKLFEANSNHGLTADGSDMLAPGSFAIIADDVAKFRTDWPTYGGIIVNSSFSLNNTGEALALRCCGQDATDRDTVSYAAETGAAGDGNSLHRNGSGWTVGAPTPGSGSILAPIVSETETPLADTGETSDGTPTASAKKPSGSFTVDAGGNRSALAKSALALSAKALASDKSPIEQADFVWAFGDGRTGSGKAISHAWGYPGKYHVTLSVTFGGETKTDAFIVDVSEARFEFVRFPDGSVGISNETGRDTDVSRWRVQESGKNFVIPEGTVIIKGATVRIAPETLGFETVSPALHYPDGSLFARADAYREDPRPEVAQVVVPAPSASVAKPTEAPPPTRAKKVAQVVPAPAEEKENSEPVVATQEASSTQLAAAATTDASLLSARWYWWFALACIIALGAVGMRVARPKSDEWIIEEGDAVES